MSDFNAQLEVRWNQIVHEARLNSQLSTREFEKLARLYGEDARHYHNAKHIVDMLTEIERYDHPVLEFCQKSSLANLGRSAAMVEHQARYALRLAAVFHDAVYNTRSRSNESDSAVMAENFILSAGDSECRAVLAEMVCKLILCTKTHSVDPTIELISGLFLDCDLLILAAPSDIYDAYSHAIRMEYRQYSDEDYRIGRDKVLRSFLNRDRIFFTSEIRAKFEQAARANISREIGGLL